MQVKIVTLKSKKTGKDFQAIKITVGEYEGLLFPSRAELAYIKSIVQQQKNEVEDLLENGPSED